MVAANGTISRPVGRHRKNHRRETGSNFRQPKGGI